MSGGGVSHAGVLDSGRGVLHAVGGKFPEQQKAPARSCLEEASPVWGLEGGGGTAPVEPGRQKNSRMGEFGVEVTVCISGVKHLWRSGPPRRALFELWDPHTHFLKRPQFSVAPEVGRTGVATAPEWGGRAPRPVPLG